MMKTLFSIFIFFIGGIVCKGQVILYSTDFGTGTPFPTGWNVSGLQASNLEISTLSNSEIYTTPISYSGGSNLNDGATGVTGGNAIITLSGQVSTVGYNTIQVLFGARKTASYNGTVTFQWFDGTTWVTIPFTDVSNSATWEIINGSTWLSLPVLAENQTNLQFKLTFSRVNNAGNYRIDDFTVQGYALIGSSSTDYFRSKQSGNWNVSSSWESSADNSTWITATLIPTSSAKTIQIRNGHTITINGSVTADELIIESGGILNHPNSAAFTINNGTGDDLTVDGTYILYGANPAGTGTYVVRTGGIIRADANTGGIADNIAMSTNARVTFKTGSIFQWNNTNAFSANGIIYFNSDTEYPVFRITQNISLNVGGGSITIIKGLFEANASITFTGAGTKTFRDGIIGSGTISQFNPCGAFIITGTNAELGGTGIINLSGSGLEIAAGAQVLLTSNKPINSSTFTNNGAFNCQAFVVAGSTSFIHNYAATLGIGSIDGITSAGTGNIQTTGRSYSSSANYTYNGTANQVTGNFTTTPVANTINSLNIANTGNTVTLTNNNLTTITLYLNSGYFASGTGQTLRIASGGIIYGNGGHNPNNATAGNIEFAGTGSTNGILPGYPNLYSVVANGAVDFNGNPNTQSATIMNRLQLNGGSFLSAAPFYSTGSTLVYNTGGVYGRNVEWGNTAGSEGYPHHVTVQANTILDLNTNAITPAQLGMGGDLTIGNANGKGEVYMNNNMNKPLSIAGSLVIGSGGATSSVLWLSTFNGGGDLWLYGSFTRYNGSSFTDNNRAVYLKGSLNGSISTPGITTPGIPSQNFNFVRLEKTSGAIITLSCAMGISKEITFTSGYTESTSSSLLVFYDDAKALATNAGSFNIGPVKKIGNDAFVFPVGKAEVVGPAGGGYRFMGISAPLQTTDAFTVEFIIGSASALGPIAAAAAALGLERVSRCEYWKLDRTNGTSAVDVTLSWNARSNCNVKYISDLNKLAIAHFDIVSNTWNLFGGKGNTTTGSTLTSGSITWPGVTTFSPFSLASTDFLENLLPLTLSSFTAKARKNEVQIDWHIMNNNDQEEYKLERSNNGVNFELLKIVEAKVILNQAAYSELDQKPYKGWNYYRLRAIDKAGEAKVSHVVKVWFGFNELIRISPNPSSEKIVINLSEPSSISLIELVNISGQVLKRINNIQIITEINISHMQAGTYYIRIQGKKGQISKTFVKY